MLILYLAQLRRSLARGATRKPQICSEKAAGVEPAACKAEAGFDLLLPSPEPNTEPRRLTNLPSRICKAVADPRLRQDVLRR